MTFGELTNILLYEKENYGTILQCLHNLHDFYAGITGVTAEHTSDQNVFLPTGKAISPGQAANCLLDIRRTAVFLRGIRKAILQLQQELNGAPVHILYAGCGPYATLLTPLTTIFRLEDVRFHLMDVNQQSVTAAEMLYKQLNATNYVEEFICADASTYQLTQPMHLVICEAMQSALAREPQVSIMLNLIPQIATRARFIPESITIGAYLTDGEQEMQGYMVGGSQPQRKHLQDIFVIGRNELPSLAPFELTIPDYVTSQDELQLFTQIDVYDDERLDVYNCGITLPLKVMDVGGKAGKKVRFEYQIGENPRFKWELVD
jgi:predicted RNA methylase